MERLTTVSLEGQFSELNSTPEGREALKRAVTLCDLLNFFTATDKKPYGMEMVLNYARIYHDAIAQESGNGLS